MNITESTFQTPIGEGRLFTLTNAQGASVQLSSLGAGIRQIIVPDRDGNMADVVLGYMSPADYFEDGPCCGKIPGRYANRIARGVFTLDGKEYHLNVNCGPNHLHGGPTGFANRLWTPRVLSDKSVCFSYRSADGEEGFPGTLTVTATYTWNDDNALELSIEATTDAPTVVNFTNHAYFNLDGEDSGCVLDHSLYLNASRYLLTDPSLAPTGEMAAVADTPMDFTTAKPLGRDIKAHFPAINYAKGYDNCWVIDGWSKGLMAEAAVLASAKSGRQMAVFTSAPAVQVYTGNWLTGSSPKSISGHDYHDYDGVAIECQGMPDAPNHPNFPSQTLRPGETFRQVIVMEFSTFS